MKLYCKKVAPEWEGVFKVGDALPEIEDNIGTELVGNGYATATKPKSNAKNKPKQETAK